MGIYWAQVNEGVSSIRKVDTKAQSTGISQGFWCFLGSSTRIK